MANNWATAILAGIGAPASQANIEKLSAWNACEGNLNGHSGLGINNPFNTTLNYGGGVSVNSAGVKSYPSMSAGIAATIQTLRSGYYTAIVGNLRNNGSNSQFASAVGSSPWGTSGGCIGNVLGSGSAPPVGGGAVSPGTGGGAPAGTGTGTGTGSGTPATTTAAQGTGSTCLLNVPLIGCLMPKALARQFLGGLVIVGGFVIVLVGASLLFKSAGLGGGKAAAGTGELLAVFPPAEEAGVALSAVGGRTNRMAAHRARGRAATTAARRATASEVSAHASRTRAATGVVSARTAQSRAGTYQYRATTDRAVGAHRAVTGRADAVTRAYNAQTGRARARSQAATAQHRADTERSRRRSESRARQYNAYTERARRASEAQTRAQAERTRRKSAKTRRYTAKTGRMREARLRSK